MFQKTSLFKKLAQIFAFVAVSTPSMLAIFFPATAHALNYALVPCGNNPFVDECTLCDLLQLIGNVTTFIILDLAAPVATLLIAYSGFKILTNGSSDTARTEAKGMIKNVVIGFLFIIFAWSIVITIMKVLLNQNDVTPWTKFQCASSHLDPNLPTRVVDLNNMQGGNNGATPADQAARIEADTRIRNGLQAVGVDVNNTNMCVGTQKTGCTSVDGLNPNTISYIELMRQKYQSTVCTTGGPECRWVLSGGSEQHTGDGAGTHAGGDKFDIRLSTVKENFVTKSNGFTSIGPRSNDGAPQWRDGLGNIWAKEGDHWDVLVTKVR